MPACNFQPSCSQFGVDALRRYGLLRGGLLTVDRLMRDTRMAMRKHYRQDRQTERFLDPVETYDVAIGR